MSYEGKYGTEEDEGNVLDNLFISSETPNLSDVDEALEVPILHIDLEGVERTTKGRAKNIVDRLAAYYFDQKYIDEHPYITNKIAQEVDNIRRLMKMLMVNEKAQDTLIASITMNSGKGTLYGSLTSLQNSMLQMQSQLTAMIDKVEKIFIEMQENCDKTFQDKPKEEAVDENGNMRVRGARELILQIEAMMEGQGSSVLNQENAIQPIERE